MGYSIPVLMENVAMSMSVCLSSLYPVQDYPNPLFLIGPGNNGGDGLSVARILASMGYTPTILVPTDPSQHRYQNLIQLCTAYGMPMLSLLPSSPEQQLERYSMIVDAFFGFSFKGPAIREPYRSILGALAGYRSIPHVSLDVPSGWLVDESVQPSSVSSTSFFLQPECLISLTLPKLCAQGFTGKWHVLCGGHFVPKSLQQSLGITIPDYGNALYLIL